MTACKPMQNQTIAKMTSEKNSLKAYAVLALVIMPCL